MILHGVGTDEEGFAYLGVRETLDGELQDVALAVGERQQRLLVLRDKVSVIVTQTLAWT